MKFYLIFSYIENIILFIINFDYIVKSSNNNLLKNILYIAKWIIEGMFLFSYLPLRILSLPLQWLTYDLTIKLHFYLRNKIKILDDLFYDIPVVMICNILYNFNRTIYVGLIVLILAYDYEETFGLAFFGLSFKLVILTIVEMIRFTKKNNLPIRF